MTAGTIMVSAGLYALSQVTSEGAYLAVWAFLGLGMRLCLYDAAFAALVLRWTSVSLPERHPS